MATTKIMIDTIDRPRLITPGHEPNYVEYTVSGLTIQDCRAEIVKHVEGMYKPTNSTPTSDRMLKEFHVLMRRGAYVGAGSRTALILVDLKEGAVFTKILRFATKEELAGGRENIKWLLDGTRDLVWEPILIEDDGIEDLIPYPIFDTETCQILTLPDPTLNHINAKMGVKVPTCKYTGCSTDTCGCSHCIGKIPDPSIATNPNWNPPDPAPTGLDDEYVKTLKADYEAALNAAGATSSVKTAFFPNGSSIDFDNHDVHALLHAHIKAKDINATIRIKKEELTEAGMYWDEKLRIWVRE